MEAQIQRFVVIMELPASSRSVSLSLRVKGGEKPYQRGGSKLDHFWRVEEFGLLIGGGGWSGGLRPGLPGRV